ncbi:MAG: hypothetical protein VW879_01895 [Opitutae bacterium]
MKTMKEITLEEVKSLVSFKRNKDPERIPKEHCLVSMLRDRAASEIRAQRKHPNCGPQLSAYLRGIAAGYKLSAALASLHFQLKGNEEELCN